MERECIKLEYKGDLFSELFLFFRYIKNPKFKALWLFMAFMYFPLAMIIAIFTVPKFIFQPYDFEYALISSAFWISGYYFTIFLFEITEETNHHHFELSDKIKIKRRILVLQAILISVITILILESVMYDLNKYLQNPIAHHQTSINHDIYGSSFSMGLVFGILHYSWGFVMLIVISQIFIVLFFIVMREHYGKDIDPIYAFKKRAIWKTILKATISLIIWVTVLSAPYSLINVDIPLLYIRYFIPILLNVILILLSWSTIQNSSDHQLFTALIKSSEEKNKINSILTDNIRFSIRTTQISERAEKYIIISITGIVTLILYFVNIYSNKSKSFLNNPLIVIIVTIIPIFILISNNLLNKEEENTWENWIVALLNDEKSTEIKDKSIIIKQDFLTYTLSQIYILLIIHNYQLSQREEILPFFPKGKKTMNNIIRNLIDNKKLLYEETVYDDTRKTNIKFTEIGFETVNYFKYYFSGMDK